MGQYSPCDVEDLNKEISEEEDSYLKYASNNLQSWKKINTNAFISQISQGEENNFDIFCIIDGNKGNEVTKFVQNHFVKELLAEIKIKKDIKIAIKESFLKMNKLMLCEQGMKEISDLRKKNNEEEIKNFKKIINENNNAEENINIFEEEDREILDYTGCTLCLILIDIKNNKLYFGNIGNSKVYIFQKNKLSKIIESFHTPNDPQEKERIKDDSLTLKNKLYGILTSSRSFGNLAYNKNNRKIISDEPDIKEYDINKKDKYIFIGSESVINMIEKDNIINTIKKEEENNENISLNEILTELLNIKIPKNFFNNDNKFGFDNMTCTLIKLKNN